MRRQWKFLLLLLLLLGIVGALSTYGIKSYLLRSQEPAKPDHVRVVELEHSLLALPHYIALAQGFYKEQNLEVTSSVPEKLSPEEEFKLSNQGDVILGNLCQTIFTQPLGTGAKMIAIAGLAQRDGTYLVGREHAENFIWKQIKRKSILGNAPDTQSNIILEEALKQQKLTLQQQVIIIQNIPLPLKEGAFHAGVGQYAQMSEPLASQTEQNGTGQMVADLGTAVGPIPSLAFFAPEAYLKKHNQTSQKLVNGLCKGLLWLDYRKSEEAARVAAPYFPDLDQQTLTLIIERYKKQGLWGKTPLIAEADYQNLKSYVKRAGELTNPVEYSDGVYAKLAKKAADTVEYVPPELQPKEKTWWEKVKTLDFK